MGEARRNRQAQVGVFVFSRKAAPDGMESLHRHGPDIVAVWDADDPESDVILRAAYSLARKPSPCAKSHERRVSRRHDGDRERAARGVERQGDLSRRRCGSGPIAQ